MCTEDEDGVEPNIEYKPRVVKENPWKDGMYNSCYLELGVIIIKIWWATVSRGEESGYRISYGNYILKRLIRDMEEAKKIGMNHAKKKLQMAIDKIKEIEKGG